MKGQNKITYNVSAEEILEELPLKDFIFFEKVICNILEWFSRFLLY
jgi:hypothetical protein